jgi:hypothetical protein
VKANARGVAPKEGAASFVGAAAVPERRDLAESSVDIKAEKLIGLPPELRSTPGIRLR